MINNLGKGLALVHAGLSIMLMAVAVALYFNAVDFGWDQPARYMREVKGKKGENLLIASLFEKRDAAVRKMVRTEQDQLLQLGGSQDQITAIEGLLAANHLEGKDVLEALMSRDGEFAIMDVKFDDKGALVFKSRYGFPDLGTKVEGVNRSVKGYVEQLKDLDGRLAKVGEETAALQDKLKKLTAMLTGEVEANGTQTRSKDGAVKEPGWYYLIEAEVKIQRELQKEIEYLRPLWLKERADSQLVLGRQYDIMRRLSELGDKSYDTQEKFLKKQR